MISLNEAIKILDENVDFPTANEEALPLQEALGRVVAEDAFTDIDFPEFDKSAMDGYALTAPTEPGTFSVIETIPAGNYPTKTVVPGTASRIMTGAPMPEGANAVVMVEKTREATEECVEVLSAAKAGENVRFRGEEMPKGTKILSKGTQLGAAELAVLASSGYGKLKVFKKLKAAVFSTGSELVPPSEIPEKGQIRDSNGPSLVSCCLSNGVIADFLGIIPDNKEQLRETIAKGLEYDFMILSGGASVGDFDYVPDLLKEAGVETLFYKVAIQPGKPIMCGKKGNCLIFALPGNPVSSYMNFLLFALPSMKKRQGLKNYQTSYQTVRLATSFQRKKAGRRLFLPATLNNTQTGMEARLTFYKGSGHMHSLTQATVSIVVPEDYMELPEGSFVEILALE